MHDSSRRSPHAGTRPLSPISPDLADPSSSGEPLAIGRNVQLFTGIPEHLISARMQARTPAPERWRDPQVYGVTALAMATCLPASLRHQAGGSSPVETSAPARQSAGREASTSQPALSAIGGKALATRGHLRMRGGASETNSSHPFTIARHLRGGLSPPWQYDAGSPSRPAGSSHLCRPPHALAIADAH